MLLENGGGGIRTHSHKQHYAFKNGAGMWMNFRRLAITQMFYFFMLFLLSLLVHAIMKTRQSCSISYNNN